MRYYLGVDGGGTLTRALFVDERGTVVGAGQAGPSNIHQVGKRVVRQNLRKAVKSALMEISGAEPKLAAACFGLAGASAPEAREALLPLLGDITPGQATPITLTTDAEIALRGGLLDEPGLLLIAGTGSICMGRDASGALHRTGGWGLLADEAGSALWIGRRAVEVAVRQADGRLPQSALGEAVFAELGIEALSQIVSVLHSPELTKAKVAQLAKIVTQTAAAGDKPALAIISGAIHEILDLARATIQKTAIDDAEIIVVGGLVQANSWFRTRLDGAFAEKLPGTRLREPILPPVAGAIMEARKMDGCGFDAAFLERVRADIDFFSE